MKRVLTLLISLAVPFGASASDPATVPSPRTLTDLSLEELMNIEITSVSKKEQRLSEAAQAVYVITQEDIRRSGATTIAEALRMAPGVNVARIDANKWAISARGFNGRFANKLLVLIDGRSVYTPLFSGVFWDVQDVVLEDIERIEVIRGPGATLWGANAVNGVINIITTSSKESAGGLLTVGAGDEERAFGVLRYGGQISDRSHYRAFFKYDDRDDFVSGSPIPANDAWHVGRGGFRIDTELGERDALTLEGGLYDGSYDDSVVVASFTPPFVRAVLEEASFSGGHLLGRWKRVQSDQSTLTAQIYYDRTERDDIVHREIRDTADLELQQNVSLGTAQQIVWGVGYRLTSDDIVGRYPVSFIPPSRSDELISAFVQDEISSLGDRLRITLGSKFEWNDYTGLETQPNIRLWWGPQPRSSSWASVSRAVRTPSRFEHDALIDVSIEPSPAGLPLVVRLFGDKDYRAEELIAWEGGYRTQPSTRLSLDVVGFFNDYTSLRTFEPGSPFVDPGPPTPHLVAPIRPGNRFEGETYGLETSASWTLTDAWRLSFVHSWLEVDLRADPSSGDPSFQAQEGDSPKHQIQLRSYLDLPHGFKLDAMVYYVDNLPNQGVPSYARVDARIGWNPRERIELALVIQNLTDSRHQEFGSSFLINPTEIERSVHGKVTWRY